MKVLKFILIFILFFPLSSLSAEQNDKINEITKNLRCLICQGQSVYDSDSEFANSMKILVDKKLEEGLTEKQRTMRLLNTYMIATGCIVGEALLGTFLAIYYVLPLITG